MLFRLAFSVADRAFSVGVSIRLEDQQKTYIYQHVAYNLVL